LIAGSHAVAVTEITPGANTVTFVDPRIGSNVEFVVSFDDFKSWASRLSSLLPAYFSGVTGHQPSEELRAYMHQSGTGQ
jgi:hypothetical protein